MTTYITDPKCATCGTIRPSLASLGTKGYTSRHCKACRNAAEAKAIAAAKARDAEYAAQLAADPDSLAAQNAAGRRLAAQHQDLAAFYAATDHAKA